MLFCSCQTLNGETLYAGRAQIIGTANKASLEYEYRARKLTKELNEKFGGDVKKMEVKYGFNPSFVQWRQEESTGGFEQILTDNLKRKATAKAKRLEQIAFLTKYPIPETVHQAIERRIHGMTPEYRHTLDLRSAREEHKRDKMKYRTALQRCKTMERAATCLPTLESDIRRGIQYPEPVPPSPRSFAKSLSLEALEGIRAMVWKLEEDFPTLSAAFKSFDKDRSGYISASEFREELNGLHLNISPEVIEEIMAFLDKNGDRQLEFTELQGAVNAVMVEADKTHWMDRTKHYYKDNSDQKLAKREAIVQAVPLNIIVELVNSKCQTRIPEMVAEFSRLNLRRMTMDFLTQTVQGTPKSCFINKTEMSRIFWKSNVSVLPKHYDVWWDSLKKVEDVIKWSVFMDGINHGKIRGRGSYVLNEVPQHDPVAEIANSPEIACLRNPDILSSPNRWELCGTFKHPWGAGFDNRRFDGTDYDLGGIKSNGGSRPEIVPRSKRDGIRKKHIIETLPAFPYPDRSFEADGLTSKLRPASQITVSENFGNPIFYKAKQRALDQELLGHFLRSGPLSIMPADTERRQSSGKIWK